MLGFPARELPESHSMNGTPALPMSGEIPRAFILRLVTALTLTVGIWMDTVYG